MNAKLKLIIKKLSQNNSSIVTMSKKFRRKKNNTGKKNVPLLPLDVGMGESDVWSCSSFLATLR